MTAYHCVVPRAYWGEKDRVSNLYLSPKSPIGIRVIMSTHGCTGDFCPTFVPAVIFCNLRPGNDAKNVVLYALNQNCNCVLNFENSCSKSIPQSVSGLDMIPSIKFTSF